MAREVDWESRITIDPKIQGGKPVIKGTRVPLQVIISGLAGGMTAADICREFLITEDDVRAALAYAAATLAEEVVHAIPRR